MRTKRILSYTTLLIVILGCSFACNNNDGYSLNDFRISIATVVPEGDRSYSLLLDNGDKLWPAAANIYYNPVLNQRVFVNYTILSDKMNGYDHHIKVNDIWNILTKPVIKLTEENADSIGNDPVKIDDFWIGNHFLNAEFSFNYSGMRPHAINLVENTTTTNNDANIIELEFRHNSYKSTNNNLYHGFACFDLKPLQNVEKDSIPIKIIVKDWDTKDTKEYMLMYKYNASNKDKPKTRTPKITSNEYK